MSIVIANNAKSTLAAGINTTATQLSVSSGDGSKFPNPGSGQWFPLTLVKVDSTFEIVRATVRSSDTITIVRAQEGTSAKSFSAGDKVELRMTAAVIAELQGMIDNNEQAAADAQSDADANAQNITSIQGIIGAYGNIVSRDVTISEGDPAGGQNGDLWLQYEV